MLSGREIRRWTHNLQFKLSISLIVLATLVLARVWPIPIPDDTRAADGGTTAYGRCHDRTSG